MICENQECKKEFLAKIQASIYCGSKCRTKANNRAKQEKRRDRSARPCGFCGVLFAPAYGDLRKSYCSAECQKKHYYRATNGTTHRRRARKFGCEYEKVDKLEVFKRDKWRCQICGVRTPKNKMGTKESNAPELGHIRSLVDGGPHSYANTQCECRGCNRSKGARSLGQLQLCL
jgi:hypothetical protein